MWQLKINKNMVCESAYTILFWWLKCQISSPHAFPSFPWTLLDTITTLLKTCKYNPKKEISWSNFHVNLHSYAMNITIEVTVVLLVCWNTTKTLIYTKSNLSKFVSIKGVHGLVWFKVQTKLNHIRKPVKIMSYLVSIALKKKKTLFNW